MGTRAGNSSDSEAWVVVPAYREASVIAGVVRELRDRAVQVVVVDDGSADATAERARAAGATVLRHAVNRGQGAALQTGIDFALAHGARFVVTFDSDGQHRAEDVDRLLDPLRRGRAEVALGSRFLGTDAAGMPRHRRALLRLAVWFTRLTSGARITDTHNGLRAFTRQAAARLDIRLDRMAHASEIIDQVSRSGAAWVEVPVAVRYTDYSRGKGQPAVAAFRIALDYILSRLGGRVR